MLALVLLLVAPTALLAHPGHAPGEPEHWVIAALFAVLSVGAVALWHRRPAAQPNVRRPGERE
jgi:hypothetical protein